MADDAPTLGTPLGPLTWRPRTDDDQGLLHALFAASRQAELDLIGGDAEQQRAFVELQLRARERHRDLTRPDAELNVLVLDGVPVGQLDLDRGETLEILEIALVPGLRGHGVGTVVLAHLLAEADAAGHTVRLHVEAGNPARRLYERLGFVASGTEGVHTAMSRRVGGDDRPAPTRAPAAPAEADDPPPVAPVTSGAGAVPTYEQLAPSIGAAVAVLPDGPELMLLAVDARPSGRPGPMPYSALLTGPPSALLPQGIHRLDLPGTGPVDVFVVPIQPRDERALYELIVS